MAAVTSDRERRMIDHLRSADRAREMQATSELIIAVARAIARLAAPSRHLDADDADERCAASCATEGPDELVVYVSAAADDEGLHEEEGS